MQGDSSQEAAFDLNELASRLTLEGMPIQRVIGEEAGVSQSTVSRAIHRQIQGDSEGAKRLWAYTEARARLLGSGDSGGGEETSAPVVAAPADAPRQRAARAPRRRHPLGRVGAAPDTRPQDLVQQAMQGLRDYLEDRFDPSLVIEQIAVLRRAQDGGRRARPADRRKVTETDTRP